MKKKLNHAFNYITAILIFICAMTVSLSIFLVKVQNSIDTNSQNIMTSTVSHQSDHVLSILQIHYGFLNSIADKMGKSSSLLSDGNMKFLVSMAENTDFERTALIEADGTAHYDNGAEKNVAQRRYFQEAMQGKETLSDPLESSIDQEMRVILGVPVYQNGNIIAVLGGSYNVTALSRMLFNDVFDNSGYSLIVNQNGEIIAYDGLTGAYNKRATEAHINKILTQMPDEKGTFVILDVDKFKDVNDRYGHAVGDTVLHELAKTFFRHFRKDDIIGRIGGDEFVIYMRNIESKEIASARVKNLIENVRSLPFEEMNGNHVTISVGIAFVPEAGNCYMDLYKNADTALYETKQNGKDGYHVYMRT